MTVNDIRQRINEISREYGDTSIIVSASSSEIWLSLGCQREETDEEYSKRIDISNKRSETRRIKKETVEKATLAKLIKKYGTEI